MREDATEIAQPLDRAGTNRLESIKVPAPRLELQSGNLNDVRSILYELAKNAKLEICEVSKPLKSFFGIRESGKRSLRRK